jgi:hypothetical protein
MKALAISMLSICILFFINCGGDDKDFNVQRVIVNNTSVPVVWSVYKNGLLSESLSIEANGEHKKNEICRLISEPNHFSCDVMTGQDVQFLYQDSIVMEFNKIKKESYCVRSAVCEVNRYVYLLILPILESDRFIGFTRTIDSQKTRVYTFTITEQDYQNAKPIED